MRFNFYLLGFFVCDWYQSVKCEESENFYNLNNQIGNNMNGYSKKELMNSAREIIMFPQQTPNYNPAMKNIYSNYPTQLGTQLGINGGGRPSGGSLNLGQSTTAVGNYPYNPVTTNGVLPQRGANGGTVYVNSLGQLSTDRDSGFDPKHSFILRPDKDSTFDQDIRIPSNSFDTLKGIGNSYSFGFPGQNNAPIRGSEDLSEPYDPAAYGNDQYLPPHLNGQNRKQLYTYPHDAQSHGQNNIKGILPEFTGQMNTKLIAKNPKLKASQVYGPPALHAQPASQNRFQQPNAQSPSSPRRFQQLNNQSPASKFNQPQSQHVVPSQTGSQQLQTQSYSPQRLYQQPHQTVKANAQQNHQQSPTVRLYQQPHNLQQQQSFKPVSQQPQPFRPQNQQIERRQFNVPHQSNGLQNKNSISNGNQPLQHPQQSNGIRNSPNGNKQSNEDYLRSLLKEKTHIHNDKVQLVELIQRFFVPSSANARVVSADVVPSKASESYSFTYSEDEATNTKSNYQLAHSGLHQHTGTCGHTNQGGY